MADVRDINQLNPKAIARLTSQVSSISASMFDVSNLKSSSSLSVSSPNLVANPATGLLSKFGRKKSKLATSKTSLLESSFGLDNAGFVDDKSSIATVEQVRSGVMGRGDPYN